MELILVRIFVAALVAVSLTGCDDPGSSASLPSDVGSASHDISVGPKADGIPVPDPDGQEAEVEASPDAIDNPDNGVTDAEVTLPELPLDDVDCGFVPALEGRFMDTVSGDLIDLKPLSDPSECAIKAETNPVYGGLTFKGVEAPLKAEVPFGFAALVPDPESEDRFSIQSQAQDGTVAVEHHYERL